MHDAHERIAAAHDTGATSLDLSGLRLRDLPPRVRELTHLRTLNLSDNRLRELPSWLTELGELTELDLRWNKLASLPDLSPLRHLTTLDVGVNRLTEVPEWIGDLTLLERLRLGKNELAALPEALASLGGLKQLMIDGNELTALPDWLPRLGRLEVLWVGGCPLRELPTFLGSMTGLRVLEAYGLGLSALPDELGALAGLQRLNLNGNHLDEIPPRLRGLAELTYLGFRGNNLTRLPDWLAELAHLRELYVYGNRLTELPAWVGRMERLTALSIGANPLPQAPRWLSRLSGLTHLDIDSLPLADSPEWLGRLTGLTHLNLARCGLTRLPDSMADLAALELLDIAGNGLTAVPEWLGTLGRLVRLRLGGNPITDLPESLARLTNLELFDVSGCRLPGLPDWLAGMDRLKWLQAEGCRLDELPEFLGELGNLRGMWLNGNPVGLLPEWLANLGDMRLLEVSVCELTKLPDCLGELTELEMLYATNNRLTELPAALGRLEDLKSLELYGNELVELPEWLGALTQLRYLSVGGNRLSSLPGSLCRLNRLMYLNFTRNMIVELPEGIGDLTRLRSLWASRNRLTGLPPSLARLRLTSLDVSGNPLAPELQAAAEESTEELLGFLRLLDEEGQFVREGKLLLVGEGEVGKSTLLAALCGEEFVEGRETTHGIDVKPLRLDPIVLNAWDFGGQRVYRPTHQLFFSAPAVYLVVWKPREGPEHGNVAYWINLIQHRAGPEARIIVVATHGGPLQRSAYLDEAALRERYGDTIVGFHHVDSRTGLHIDELRRAIAETAAAIPHIGRWYPRSWQRLREALREDDRPYLTYAEYEAIARSHGLSATSAKSLARNAHALGHWIHYTDDPSLEDLVILKADWLATAISLVLDDPATIKANGLLRHRSLAQLWDDPRREQRQRYHKKVHRVFLQLMERFDISYRVTDGSDRDEPTSLVAQLVRADRPDLSPWTTYGGGLEESAQICEIVETATGSPGTPEGLMYQLIVRFHRYSLGRHDYRQSVHWQHGAVLDAGHHGRALMTMERNRVHVTVRGAYPQLLLHQLTEDVREQVHSFWLGLAATVKVACGRSCSGLFDVENLVKSKEKGRTEYPCHVCGEWKDIDGLLLGVRRAGAEERLAEAVRVAIRPEIAEVIAAIGERVDRLDVQTQRAMGQAEERYRDLLAAFDDEAREGPRLFTVAPVDSTLLRPGLLHRCIRLTLWCEHSRLPLHVINGESGPSGIYDIDVPREWLVKAGPWLNAVSMVVRTFLPVSLAGLKLGLDESQWSMLGEQLEFAEKAIDAVATSVSDAVGPDAGQLRTVHALLRERDPSFGGLERIRDGHRYRWVHPRFVPLYRLPAPEIPQTEGG